MTELIMNIHLTQNLQKSSKHPHLSQILEKFTQAIKSIYQDDLVGLILFGSQARGDAKPASDIDILVVLKDGNHSEKQHQKVIQLISNLCLEYEVLVSCIYLSESQFNQEKSPLLLNIQKEGIIL